MQVDTSVKTEGFGEIILHFANMLGKGSFGSFIIHSCDFAAGAVSSGVRFILHSPRAAFATEESLRGVDISNIRERGRWTQNTFF